MNHPDPSPSNTGGIPNRTPGRACAHRGASSRPHIASRRNTGQHPRAPRAGDVRIPSGCAIAAIMDRSGKRHDGSDILRSIALMHDRSNGLGGGFAAYGIYPEYASLYAFHIM